MKALKFSPTVWKTPNTYDKNYAEPPQSPGVYIIACFTYRFGSQPSFYHEVLYVGSSSNLYNRYKSHPMISIAQSMYTRDCGTFKHIQFFFMECESRIINEALLIHKYRPPLNKHYPNIQKLKAI